MNQTICESYASYAKVSCGNKMSADNIALPFIQIATLLIIIIVLAVIGIFIRVYTKKVRAATKNSAIESIAAQAEQDEIIRSS